MARRSKPRKVYKVRALVTDRHGHVYMITGRAAHIQQLPGGTVKGRERRDLEAAIRREVEEETGFRKMRIEARTAPVKTRRNGTVEVTVCFHVVVSGKQRRPHLTGREKARGLTATRYRTHRKALDALHARIDAYGRSAARRDLALARAVLAA